MNIYDSRDNSIIYLPIHANVMLVSLFSGVKVLIFDKNKLLIINDYRLYLLCPVILLLIITIQSSSL